MKKNKILSLLVAVTMLASVALSVSAATFEDVSEETHGWAIEAIEEMARNVNRDLCKNIFLIDTVVKF